MKPTGDFNLSSDLPRSACEIWRQERGVRAALAAPAAGDDVRWDEVWRVRRALARGDYLTDAKLRVAVERLLKVMN